MSMSKLDQHANMIKKIYAETKTIKGTRDKLIEKGVKVSYETLRQWLKNHKEDLPTLRTGAGRPKLQKAAHLFNIIDDSAKWMPDAGIHPQWFLMFSADTTPELQDVYLVAALLKYGVQTTLQFLETTELPLTRMRDLCDLELYVMAYLLGHHAPLMGSSKDDFVALTRVLTPMVIEFKNVIFLRNIIEVGELRDLGSRNN